MKTRTQVLVINSLLYVAVDRLASFERHHTVAGREAAEALGIFAAGFVNTFLVSFPCPQGKFHLPAVAKSVQTSCLGSRAARFILT